MATPTKGAATAAPDVVWRGNGFGRLPARITGGFRRCWFSSDSGPSSSMRIGRRFRTAITPLARIFRRSIRPRSSATRRTPVRPEAALVSRTFCRSLRRC